MTMSVKYELHLVYILAHGASPHELEMPHFAHVDPDVVDGRLDVLDLHLEEGHRVLVVLLHLVPIVSICHTKSIYFVMMAMANYQYNLA